MTYFINIVKLCFNTHGACETLALVERAWQTAAAQQPIMCPSLVAPSHSPLQAPPCTQTWANGPWVKQHALPSCNFSPLQDTIFQYTSKADVLKVELEEAEWLYGVPAAEALEDPERVRTVSRCSDAQACWGTALHLIAAEAVEGPVQ